MTSPHCCYHNYKLYMNSTNEYLITHSDIVLLHVLNSWLVIMLLLWPIHFLLWQCCITRPRHLVCPWQQPMVLGYCDSLFSQFQCILKLCNIYIILDCYLTNQVSKHKPFPAAKLSYQPSIWWLDHVGRAARFPPSPSWLAEAIKLITNTTLITCSLSPCQQHRGPDRTVERHWPHHGGTSSLSLQAPYA